MRGEGGAREVGCAHAQISQSGYSVKFASTSLSCFCATIFSVLRWSAARRRCAARDRVAAREPAAVARLVADLRQEVSVHHARAEAPVARRAARDVEDLAHRAVAPVVLDLVAEAVVRVGARRVRPHVAVLEARAPEVRVVVDLRRVVVVVRAGELHVRIGARQRRAGCARGAVASVRDVEHRADGQRREEGAGRRGAAGVGSIGPSPSRLP